jgi:hypothetical protein
VVEQLKKYITRVTPKEGSVASSYGATDLFRNDRSAEMYYLRKEAREFFKTLGVVRTNVLWDD